MCHRLVLSASLVNCIIADVRFAGLLTVWWKLVLGKESLLRVVDIADYGRGLFLHVLLVVHECVRVAEVLRIRVCRVMETRYLICFLSTNVCVCRHSQMLTSVIERRRSDVSQILRWTN